MMKNIILHIAALALAAALAVTCVYPFTPEISYSDTPHLVVEGNINAGGYSTFALRTTQPIASDGLLDTDIIAAQELCVETSSGQKFHSSGTTVDTRAVKPSDKVRLLIKVTWASYSVMDAMSGGISNYNTSATGTRSYQTDWMDIKQASPIDSLTYSINNEATRLSINVSTHGAPGQSDVGYYRWYYEEDYSYTSYYTADLEFDPKTWKYTQIPVEEQTHRCYRSGASKDIMTASTEGLKEDRLVNHEIISFNKSDKRMSDIYRITLHQCSITKEEYAYYEMMRKNSTDVGGLMSPQPSEMRGNITCVENPDEAVIGFISASEVVTDTLYVRNGLIRFYKSTSICEDLTQVYNEAAAFEIYQTGYRPVLYVEDEKMAYYGWAPERCVDCRMEGGTIVMPENWKLY